MKVKETDLLVHARKDLTALATDLVLHCRHQIETYIEAHPEFAVSLHPLAVQDPAPRIVREMAQAAARAGVGPMAAVAGAIAHHVGMALLSMESGSREILIENGGDLFIKTDKPVIVGLYAGNSPLSFRIGLRIRPRSMPTAVCTSSGTVGHSLSLGKADAVCVVAPSGALADAAATAVGNGIRSKRDISKGIELGRRIPGVTGLMAVVGSEMGVWGGLELVPL